MSYLKKHKEGIVITTVFHVAILLIMLTFGYFTPLPLPDEKGVLVDFGNSNTGLGKIEPAPRQSNPVEQQQVQQQQVETQPAPVTPPPSPAVNANEGKEELMTQDYEETVAIDEGKRKKEEAERLKREEEARKRKQAEDQRKREELEKQREQQVIQQRLAEAEKRRKDSIQKIEEARQAELRRIAEQRRQDSIKRAEELARIDAINSRAKNVFGNSNGQNESGSNTNGQGVTYGGNNQGSTNGTSGAERYGPGGGEGISYNLTGRSAQNLKKPEYPGQEEGVVVVEIRVNNQGAVVQANAGVKGSTSLNQGLIRAAQNAAMATRFNADPNAPAVQTGTITYRFVLN